VCYVHGFTGGWFVFFALCSIGCDAGGLCWVSCVLHWLLVRLLYFYVVGGFVV